VCGCTLVDILTCSQLSDELMEVNANAFMTQKLVSSTCVCGIGSRPALANTQH
jgi:hypothetical protein